VAAFYALYPAGIPVLTGGPSAPGGTSRMLRKSPLDGRRCAGVERLQQPSARAGREKPARRGGSSRNRKRRRRSWEFGFGVSALAVLVTVGLIWKKRAFDFRFRKGALVGLYAGLGIFWLLAAWLDAAGPTPWYQTGFRALLGLVWLVGAAWVWKRPEHFRLRNS